MRQPCNLLILLTLLSPTSTHAGASWCEIVGGHEAKPHSRPYMAYLKTTNLDFCGGFLVHPGWVMTAAHCKGNLTVILGAHNIHKQENSQQTFAVQSYHPHPAYQEHPKDYDILLLKLKGKATENKYVSAIGLPKAKRNVAPRSQCSTAGWGHINKGKATDKLFETNVFIWSPKECRAVNPGIINGIICASSKQRVKNCSQGDGGSPLVCNGTAEGIFSYDFNNPPGFYTSIASHLHWIKTTMKKQTGEEEAEPSPASSAAFES
ncbi:mast cell protease 1A-like [Chelonoidis abingdonii]|uniref:mast cell protease 1A-like n=1 Tax=Chelonoidis abingdonii TaxID=106734 RepID=UPI0013F27D77|nr:mast cell protease 1A-like [Chelonoidis abingdonii]